MDKKNNYRVKAIDRAIKILDLLALKKASIAEISEELSLPKSSVYSIILTMEEKSIVEKQSNGRYKLGIKLFQLGSQVLSEFDVKKIALPFMEDLVEQIGETCHLGIIRGKEVIYIEKVESSLSFRLSSRVGITVPLYCTALGKVLLAYLEKEKGITLLSALELKPYTEKSLTSRIELLQELEKINKQGYAIDDNEHEKGVRCFAAPIKNHRSEVIAAISISGLDTRLTPEKDDYIIKTLTDACNNISNKIGYNG